MYNEKYLYFYNILKTENVKSKIFFLDVHLISFFFY